MRSLLTIALLFGLASQAAAQTCVPAGQLLERLVSHYQERIVFMGQNTAGNPVIVTLSDTGSWTLLAVRQTADGEGLACIISSGRHGLMPQGEVI